MMGMLATGFLLAMAVAATPEGLHPRALGAPLTVVARGDREAARVVSWTRGLDPALFAIAERSGCASLVVATHGGATSRLDLEHDVAAALIAWSRHEYAVDQAGRAPVSPAIVADALLDPRSAEAIADAFARAYAGPEVHDPSLDQVKPFEPGGVAYLESRGDRHVLRLIAVDDPVHALARALLAARRRPGELRGLLAADPLARFALDPNGLVAAFLERHPPEASATWGDRQVRGLDLVLSAVAANAADSSGYDAYTLALAVARERPEGLYLGRWHGHPGRGGGDPPSNEDRDVARSSGRFLTLVERTDGFDVHDLTRDDPNPAPVFVRHVRLER